MAWIYQEQTEHWVVYLPQLLDWSLRCHKRQISVHYELQGGCSSPVIANWTSDHWVTVSNQLTCMFHHLFYFVLQFSVNHVGQVTMFTMRKKPGINHCLLWATTTSQCSTWKASIHHNKPLFTTKSLCSPWQICVHHDKSVSTMTSQCLPWQASVYHDKPVFITTSQCSPWQAGVYHHGNNDTPHLHIHCS